MARTCFFLIALFLFLSTGDSLKCYKCEAQKGEHSACEELSRGVEHLEEQECSADQTCAVHIIKNNIRDIETIKRACESKNICEKLKDDEGQFSKVEHCHVCNTDLCNSGEMFRFSFVAMIAGLILCKFVN